MTPMPWPVWRSLRAQALAESWRLRYSLPGRYPWADLEAYAATLGITGHRIAGSKPVTPARAIADRCGFDRTTPIKWERRGWLSIEQADRAAIGLGVHPCEIWSHWFTTCDLEES